MDDLQLAALITSACSPLIGSGLVLLFMRRSQRLQDERDETRGEEIKELMGSLRTVTEQQHSCQLNNALTFATKNELHRVERKCDEGAIDLAGVKARMQQ